MEEPELIACDFGHKDTIVLFDIDNTLAVPMKDVD